MKRYTWRRFPLVGMIAAALLFNLLPGALPARAADASVTLEPSVTLPNQDISLTGTNFPANDMVTVYLTVNMRDGGNRTLTATAFTDNTGNFAAFLRVPYGAAPGTYSVTARASYVETSNRLRVLPLSANPPNLNFRWISLWYHTVRQGTWDYVMVQSALQTQLGVWVHVIFPNGLHWDFYTNSDNNGRWAVKFTIPKGSVSRHSNQAYITFQLWHGNQTTQSFMDFTLV